MSLFYIFLFVVCIKSLLDADGLNSLRTTTRKSKELCMYISYIHLVSQIVA